MEILALDPTRFYCILFEDLNMIAQYYAILAELYLLSLAHRLALATWSNRSGLLYYFAGRRLGGPECFPAFSLVRDAAALFLLAHWATGF
jgi:hypothetical protein